MAERQVTVDAQRYLLPPQFFVIATQNPMDQHGTYPLPEAELDRFAMKLSIGYPGPDYERKVLSMAVGEGGRFANELEPIFAPHQLVQLQNEVARVHVDSRLQDYLIALATATRNHPYVSLGVSPRGVLTWQRVAQANAFLDGRNYVIPDDIQATAMSVLKVRLGIDYDDATPLI